MQEVTITELDSNLSFKAKIDNPPEIKQNFTTVYVDEKEVKRPTVAQSNGLMNVQLSVSDDKILIFIKKWYSTKKRIDLMLENDAHMYLIKGCSVKKLDTSKNIFIIFYNTFKEA